MSNTEPDAGGTQNFFRSMFQRNTTVNAMAGSEIKIAGLEDATRQMSALNAELKGLVTSLTGLSQQQAQLTSGISNTMKTISTQASQTASAVSSATDSVGKFRSGAMSVASIFGSAVNSNFVKDLAMFPLRYITGATEQARNLSMGVSTSLGGQMYATGQSQSELMRMMAAFPGGVQGGVEDLINLQQIMRASGAMPDLSMAFGRTPGTTRVGGALGQPNPRAVGFLRGVQEMQAMTPGVSVAQLGQTLGGYAVNTGAQQQAAYNTGGAFAIIGAGGRQKSVSEWAEGILKWLVDQRPGDQRGKGFDYGSLLAQYFPGSNIDAWLTMNGVPDGMKEYWWNYALAKARLTGSTTNNVIPAASGTGLAPQPFKVTPVNTGPGQGGNQAFARLQAASAQARGQLNLGGQLTGMFTNKETANTWFNEIISQVMTDVIPKQIAGGSLQAMGVLPDPIQELLMTFLERSGTIGAALGGYLGYGISGLSNINAGLFQQLFAGGLPTGALGPDTEAATLIGGFGANPNAAGISDITSAASTWLSSLTGDVGDAWTQRGTSSTAGLHPTVRSGIDRMIGDNPRIRVTSGLRDTVQQRRLRAAGNTNVSGKPSAHTRGLAADLGPRSEYGWISANAHRYGLKSGRGHGEPWHVGLPGVGDIGDLIPAINLTPTPPSPNPPAAGAPTTVTDSRGNIWHWNGVKWELTGTTPVIGGGPTPTTPGPISAPVPIPPVPAHPNDGQKYTDQYGVTWTWKNDGANSRWVDPQPPTPGVPAPPLPAGQPGSNASGGAGTGTTTAAIEGPGLGNLIRLFSGGITKQGAIDTVGSLVPTLLNLFLGTFAGTATSATDTGSIGYDPNLYASLRKAAGIISVGGKLPVNPNTSIIGAVGGGLRDLLGSLVDIVTGGGGPDSLMDSDSSAVALPTGGGRGSKEAGIRAATALFNAGFKSRSDLETITAISWRESKWDPSVKNPNTSDRGLMQINMSAHRDTLRALGYGESDLLDIQKNANVAYKLWHDGGGDYGSFQQLWGFSTHSPYVPGGVGWDKHGDPLGRTQGSHAAAIVAEAHLPTTGDLDTAAYSMDPTTYTPMAATTGGNGKMIMFNNHFVINGGGQGGGIDMRRTVTMLADQLEGVMRQRLARTN